MPPGHSGVPPDAGTDELLERVRTTLEVLIGPAEAKSAAAVARTLLQGSTPGEVDTDGLRATLLQLVRNRDPAMQLNHLTELRIGDALAQVSGRRIEVERLANERNERRVDFGIDDADGTTTLVEVKNLNAPLIKKANDAVAMALRQALQGTLEGTDLHITYLFFRRPRQEELAELVARLRQHWLDAAHEAEGGVPQVCFVPARRPRVAGLIVSARADTGGRVVVYDHGQHLQAEPGSRLRVIHHDRRHQRRPREIMEEMFVKDNILRRLQDAEQKFPLEGGVTRAVLFCQGAWAPVMHVDRYLDQAIHWYRERRPAPQDIWGALYPHWAERWSHAPLYNIDAILAVRPAAPSAADYHGGERTVRGGDVDYWVRAVFLRRDGLVDRIFGAPSAR